MRRSLVSPGSLTNTDGCRQLGALARRHGHCLRVALHLRKEIRRMNSEDADRPEERFCDACGCPYTGEEDELEAYSLHQRNRGLRSSQ